uniref:response regulator transcription factor n=1 Tax=Pseudonocardia sp. CA-138482 TaxID=3240023 RepID=UPI003F491DF1
MRILVISDDSGESGYLAGAVRRRGCNVVAVSTVRAGLAALGDVDLALLNIESAGADVVAAVEEIRAVSDLPLIVMVTRTSSDKCAEVLLAGADDYLARLVNIDELLVRIQVLLRRRPRYEGASWRLVADDVEIDLERRLVLVAGEHVELTKNEFKVLSLIARQGGRVCTREKILASVWGNTGSAVDETLRAHVTALRSKIGRPELIETVEFVGYRFATQPSVHSEKIGPAGRGAERG